MSTVLRHNLHAQLDTIGFAAVADGYCQAILLLMVAGDYKVRRVCELARQVKQRQQAEIDNAEGHLMASASCSKFRHVVENCTVDTECGNHYHCY